MKSIFQNIINIEYIIILLAIVVSTIISQGQTILNEGFEQWPPEDWQILELGTADDGWILDWEGVVHTGVGSASSGIDNDQCDNWLVSSPVEISNNQYLLKYWEINADTQFYDKVSVLVSNGSNNPGSGDFVELYESNILNTDNWEQREIDLSAFEGETVYVAFRYEGTWHKWYIDDVAIAPSVFTDVGLNKFVSPIGVSETPTVEPVSVEIENLGTTVIDEISIGWKVNQVDQTSYDTTGLNLIPGETKTIILGNFDFNSEGNYIIDALITLASDFDPSNDALPTNYEIASSKDGAVVRLVPDGMVPIAGNIDIMATIANMGENTLQATQIDWMVDGVIQTPYSTSNLNLESGKSIDIVIGQYDFDSGLYELSVTLQALGDTNALNDQFTAKIAVDTFWESFEGQVFPPEGWTIDFGTKDGVNFDIPVDGDYYYVSSVDNNFFGTVSDTIFTPLLQISNGDHFRFYIKTNAFNPANHKLVWKDGETGEINFIQNIANSTGLNSWELRDINISAAAGVHNIGIVSTSTGSVGESKFDLFTSDAKLFLYENDIKIVNGDMKFLAKQNTEEVFECIIRNAGSLPIDAASYSVKLMEAPNTELSSVPGAALNVWGENKVAVPYNFSDLGTRRLFFEIEYASDENVKNNTFRKANVSVVPSTVEISEIGSPDFRDANIPFTPNGSTQSLGEDDLSQLLYYQNEFNSPGYVYGIAYKYDNLLAFEDAKPYPLKVWITQSNVPNMDNGWLPKEELTLVFDGIVEFLPGNNRDLYIPFDQPILLNGSDNVIIQNYQFDPVWPPAIFRFLSSNQSSGATRSISVADYFDLDPDNPPIGFNAFSYMTYTRFVVDPVVAQTDLTGVVYDNNTSLPIENATIAIAGSSLSSQSDIDGQYALIDLTQGSYSITVSALGYQDKLVSIDLNEDNQTQDFYLDTLIEVTISGSIVGDNNIIKPLEFADVAIYKEGNLITSTVSNALGEFSFPTIFGGLDYEIKISMYGYYDQTLLVSPIDIPIELGEIILKEEFISPFDVFVSTNGLANVLWKSPKLSSKVKLQQDLGQTSFSYTNEVNENVWLGNSFGVSDTTTLTSVEFQTDVYPNAVDFVTIDVMDLKTKKVLASSEPFLIYKDSLHQVNIPNITVLDDFVAMIHWENNPASTNAFAVDFSDPDIPNSAVIKYPGQDIQKLNAFLGGGAPNMSFLIRVHTLDKGNPITNNESVSYNIYRGRASEFPNISNWTKINANPVTEIRFEDANTSNTDPNEYYRYAIETIYTNGNSEVSFSNEVLGSLIISIKENFLSAKILVYPNPTNDKLTISLDESLNIEGGLNVYNALGKQVLTINQKEFQSNSLQQDITQLDRGMYFLEIRTAGTTVTKMFIVQ